MTYSVYTCNTSKETGVALNKVPLGETISTKIACSELIEAQEGFFLFLFLFFLFSFCTSVLQRNRGKSQWYTCCGVGGRVEGDESHCKELSHILMETKKSHGLPCTSPMQV
jgi:hypothetical protein